MHLTGIISLISYNEVGDIITPTSSMRTLRIAEVKKTVESEFGNRTI